MSSTSSTSIVMAVIVDSNNTVSYYPENSRTERSFKDALFAFTTSGSSKATPMTVVSQSYDENRYTHVAMHDDQNNFAGVCLSPCISSNKNENDDDDDDKTDQYEQVLLKDLVAIANISSLASGLDDGETFRSRVTRLFAERCSSSSSSAATMQGVEVLKRVLEKKKGVNNKKNSKTTTATPEKEKKPAVAGHEKEDNINKSTNSSTVVVVDKGVHDEIVQEEERVDTACREQLKNASTRPMHHHHVSYHTEEFEKEWKQFEKTNQYKAGVGVLGISAIVATVMMLCSPTLASCTA